MCAFTVFTLSSYWAMISGMVSRPMSMGTRAMPSTSSLRSKVSLGREVPGSRPIKATSRPSSAVMRPLSRDLPEAGPTMVRAMMATAVNSPGPNCRATRARFTARKISTMSLKVSPITEAVRDILSALMALPALARAWPSATVAAAAEVPGAHKSIAEMEPPKMPPL